MSSRAYLVARFKIVDGIPMFACASITSEFPLAGKMGINLDLLVFQDTGVDFHMAKERIRACIARDPDLAWARNAL